MRIEDLTGAWVDNPGNVRQVLPDPEWPGDDMWLVTNPAVARRVGRYDGDTIRGNWDRICPSVNVVAFIGYSVPSASPE